MNLTTKLLRRFKYPGNDLPGIAAVIVVCIMTAGCSANKREREDQKLNYWRTTLTELETYHDNLKTEREQVQRFIESAEVHQVLRSEEEKERQLKNLNLYKTEIEIKIDSIKKLIVNFSDSIKLVR